MEIIKRNGEVVTDYWRLLDDLDPLPPGGDVLVSQARFLRDRKEMDKHDGRVGVWLASDDELEPLVHDIAALPLIALQFPKFTDGRAYSKARLLRERYKYDGELRAVGNVLADQLFYMARCGIDSFALQPGKSVQAAVEALRDFSVTYQAAADDPRPLFRRVPRGFHA